MVKLCLASAVTDWTRNNQIPREGDFGLTEIRTTDPLPMIPYQVET